MGTGFRAGLWGEKNTKGQCLPCLPSWPGSSQGVVVVKECPPAGRAQRHVTLLLPKGPARVPDPLAHTSPRMTLNGWDEEEKLRLDLGPRRQRSAGARPDAECFSLSCSVEGWMSN